MSSVLAKDNKVMKIVVLDLPDGFVDAILEVTMPPDLQHRSTITPAASSMVIATALEAAVYLQSLGVPIADRTIKEHTRNNQYQLSVPLNKVIAMDIKLPTRQWRVHLMGAIARPSP